MCCAPPFEDNVFLDWFLMTLLAPIFKDVTSHFPQTEEEALYNALRYDLIYSQYSYVFIVIPELPWPSGPNASGASHTIFSIIGVISHPSP